MNSISIKHSSLFKYLIVAILATLLSIPVFYGINTVNATFLIISIVGVTAISFIESLPIIKYSSMVVFILKSFILFYSDTAGNLYMFPDSYNYIETLNNIIQTKTLGFDTVSGIAGTLHVGFYYIYFFIYSFFQNELSIVLINTLLVTISGILFYKIFKKRFSNNIALITFFLFNLSANVFLFGSLILKDPLVIFLISLSLYLYLNKNKLLLSLIVSIFLITVRIYSGFAIIAGIVVDYFIFSDIPKKRKRNIGLALGLIIIVAINLPITQSYLQLSSRFLLRTSFLGILLVIPSTLIKFFFAPLPWNILSADNIYRFLFFDSIIMMLLSFGLLLFIAKWIKYKDLRSIFYIFLVPILFHALTLGIEYGGDSTRQRSGIFIFLILVLTIGIFYKPKSYSE